MTDIAENVQADASAAGGKPAALKPVNTVVTQILGRVDSPSAVRRGVGQPNNSRWIFDVETLSGVDVVFYLLEYRSGRALRPDMLSFDPAPLDEAFYDARPSGYHDVAAGTFTLRSKAGGPRFACRVTLDIMYSATR